MRATSLFSLVSLGAVFLAGSAVVSGCTSLPDLVDEGDASVGNEITLADGGRVIVESDGAIVPTGDDTNPASDGATGTTTGDDGATGTMTGGNDAGMMMMPDAAPPLDAAGPPDTGPPPPPPVCVDKTSCGDEPTCSGCSACAPSVHPCMTCAQISCNGSIPTGDECCVDKGIATCAKRSGILGHYMYSCN